MKDIRERLRALSGGITEKAVLVMVANQLRNERFNPREILKTIKQETGVGLSLRTTFKKPEGSKDIRKASNAVEQRVQKEIVAETKQHVEKVLEVGKSVLNRFELLARFNGYTNVVDFLDMTYNFWDLNHDHVRELEEENLLLKWAVKELVKIASPEVKKIARLHEWSELAQLVTMGGMLTGNFPPPYLLYEISKTYRTVLE